MKSEIVEILQSILEQDLSLIHESMTDFDTFRSWGVSREKLFQSLQELPPSSSTDRTLMARLVQDTVASEQIVVRKFEQNLTSLADEIRSVRILRRARIQSKIDHPMLIERIAEGSKLARTRQSSIDPKLNRSFPHTVRAVNTGVTGHCYRVRGI